MSFEFLDSPVLGIETSCDETAAAVVHGREVLSSVVASQAGMHARWGGVVPEAAARAHVEALLPVLHEAESMAGVRSQAIAVTDRPGLIGALSTGITMAKALAYARDLPLVGVHHLFGHLVSPFARFQDYDSPPPVPHLCVIVSGGHTEVVLVRGPGDLEILVETIDDAAGEAFDKGARLLGLGYPGGAELERLAKPGDPTRYSLPIGVRDDPRHFSFSGLKTAMLRLVEREGESLVRQDAAASLQSAIVEALASKVEATLERVSCRGVSLAGGVAANRSLREALSIVSARNGCSFHVPPMGLCTDNAAMIALAGSSMLARGMRDGLDLDASATAKLNEA